MIKVQDWVASIPDEEKHIAYVGEGKSVQKEFLLCGDGWEAYQHWTFSLDMAFDLKSITTHDSRQVVSTRINRSEIDEATGVTADETIFKETYTVYDEDVLGYNQTDIAPLIKRVEKDGIHLIWTVLRQHTVLPGKLWATLRAASGEIDQIKKSDIMVFEVDAAVCAVPATVPAISEMEQIRQQAAEAKDAATAASSGANAAANRAYQAAGEAWNAMYECENYAELVTTKWEETSAYAQAAQQAQEKAAAYARAADQSQNVAAEHNNAASEQAEMAQQAAQTAMAASATAADAATEAEQAAVAAEEAARRSKALIVTTELVQDGMAYELKSTHAASEIYEHLQNGGTAVLDWMDGECLTLSSCTEEAAVFSAVTKNGKDARATIVTIDNDKGWSQSGATLGGGGTAEYNRVNVRDYGAVGDGVADDRAAIVAAFTAAKSMLPCEVYFPAGTYGISNGITVNMALGTGGLLVRGAGWNTTTIKYLESYNPRQTVNQWYAIRIWPAGMPNTAPSTEDNYLHDISITGLSVYDTNPCAHAIHPDKGDSNKEETHGFDIQYCKRVSVTDCKIDSVGDEAIDIFACHDVIVANNHIVNSPAAGSAGGAISIGDGSKNVVVSGNTINKTAEDETLEDGTVIAKSNFGIAVESLATPITDVIVTDNTIHGVRGGGVHFNTPNAGASITNLSITNNILNGCTNGIVSSGTKPMNGLKIHNNAIADCAEYGINLAGDMGDVTIVGNTIRNCKYGAKVVQLSSRQLHADNLFEDIVSTALYVRGQTTVKNCVFKNVGTTEGTATIYNDASATTNGTLVVSGCTMTGVRTKNAIYGAQTVRDTDIEFVDENGDVVYNHNVFGGSKDCFLRDLSGGKIGGRIEIQTSNGSVSGVKLTYAGGSAHAVQLNANRTRVIGCYIDADNGSYKAIVEKSGMNHNLVANNIVNKAITTTGAQSVAVNNIDTRVTA